MARRRKHPYGLGRGSKQVQERARKAHMVYSKATGNYYWPRKYLHGLSRERRGLTHRLQDVLCRGYVPRGHLKSRHM